ncbi:MAG: cytochrome c biogenesis protein CcsA [Planctomycetota bacterium]|nr:cytochrome c biogenesis protein CcsA [Planctomycetota bacterium]
MTVILLAVIAGLCLVGIQARDRRYIKSARVGFYINFILILAASGTLVWGFIAGCYNNEYIWGYSDKDLPFFFKFAGLWAGLDGSLLFWTLILAGVSALAALQHRWSSLHPSGRRMEPYVYLVLCAIIGFFVALAIRENPFNEMEPRQAIHLASAYNIPLDHQGNLLNGKGLNPQLVNYWFVIHPPCLYLGMVIFAVPFAFGMAALISGELGSYWVRVTRRWTMAAWLFLTCGIILGGLWAYRQLGWGGYWAWDPVENASFLPWCAATAFLHSIMIQERRDMLKRWNVFLLIFAFFLTIEATYMTRSGEISSVHSFGENVAIGNWFRCFKWGIIGSGLFLLFYRFNNLKGSHRLDSLLSREAAFFFNNLVLVVLAVSVWALSWLPNLSSAYFSETWTFEPQDFNLYMSPLLALLLLLTAIGPGLGWIKSSQRSLRKNFLVPGVLAVLLTAGAYLIIALLRPDTISIAQVFSFKPLTDALNGKEVEGLFYSSGIYPTGYFLFFSFLIMTTIGMELVRNIRAKSRLRKQGLLSATLSLLLRDNRRYGGYTVHIGISVLVIGIVISSMFKITEEKLSVRIGEYARIGDYLIHPFEANRPYAEIADAYSKVQAKTHRVEDFEEGLPYLLDQVAFRIYYAPEGSAGIAHAQEVQPEKASPPAGSENLKSLPPDAALISRLDPERRFYPKQDQWINEVSIHRTLLQDVYIYYSHRGADDVVSLTAYLNPFMGLLYIGTIIMLLGGIFAALPFSGNRVGLAE